MHYFVKSQNQWGLKNLVSDTKLMNKCSFTKDSKEIVVCSKW